MTPPCLLPAPRWVLSWQHNCVLEEQLTATSYYVALETSHSASDPREILTKQKKNSYIFSFAVCIHPQLVEKGGN